MLKPIRTMAIFTGAITLCMGLASQVFAEHEIMIQERTIEARGTARVKAEPDRAKVTMSVINEASTAKSAAELNAAQMNKVLKNLEKLAGDKGKVTTQSYDLRPVYEYKRVAGDNKRVLKGYQAVNRVEVDTSDLATLGTIIDGAVNAGSNEVQSVHFYVENDAAVRRQALLEAGREAREKAEAIAESLGATLGNLVHATSELGDGPRPMPMARMAMAMEADAASGTTINPQEIDVEMSVRAIFEIE